MKTKNVLELDTWITPRKFYDELHIRYSFYYYDPCPPFNDITEFDGLADSWAPRTFCNPPYSLRLKEKFLWKGYEEYCKGKLVVFLLPVSTGTKIFHELMLQHGSIEFIKGRLRFEGIDRSGNHINPGEGMYKFNAPPGATQLKRSGQFDSMLWILDGVTDNYET